MDREHIIRRRSPNESVKVGLRSGETEQDMQHDFDVSFNAIDDMRVYGVQEWRSRYRWIGPIKILAYKEVGPPPWKLPKVLIQGCRLGQRKLCTIRFTCGWRSTAYALVLMWAGRHV